MKKLIWVWAILVGLLPPLTFAQSPENNLMKYWKHRYRLEGDGTYENIGFLKFGTGPGTMIPAERVLPWGDCYDNFEWGSNAGTCDGMWGVYNPGDRGAILFAADGTHHLGHLMGVLATEYRLLVDHGQDASGTLEDIYNALEAFERLDRQAEVEFGLAPDLNGFFLRDDVPHTMLQHFQTPNDTMSYTCLQSNLICNEGRVANGEQNTNVMSQDQAIYILMGLSMVKKCVPTGTMFNGVDVRLKAQQNAHRIGTFLRDNNWVIRDPNNQRVRLGWSAKGLSYAIATTIDWITENNVSAGFLPSYQNGFSFNNGLSLWVAQMQYYGLGQTAGDVNDALFLTCAATSGLLTQAQIENYSQNANIEIMALLRSYLHNSNPSNAIETFLNGELDIAPCDRFCNQNLDGNGQLNWVTYLVCNNNNGWRSCNRWFHNSHRNGGQWEGIFNGLDFMLLYNLKQLSSSDVVYRDVWGGAGSFTETFPKLTPNILNPAWQACSGCEMNPQTLITNGIAETSQQIYSFANHPLSYLYPLPAGANQADWNSNVTLRAGQAIVLKPGFYAEHNAYFHGYIDPFECGAGDIFQKNQHSGTEPEGSALQEFMTGQESLIVFPNPTSGSFSVQLRLPVAEKVRISIHDLAGRSTGPAQELWGSDVTAQFDLEGRPAGIYLVKIEKESGPHYKKVTVRK